MQSVETDLSAAESIQTLPLAVSKNRISQTRHSVPARDHFSTSSTDPAQVSRKTVESTLTSHLLHSGPTEPRSRATFLQPPERQSSFEKSHINSALPGYHGRESGGAYRLILNAFVPHVAIYASRDTNELAREKGFGEGFWKLLLPFGERIQAKIQFRENSGAVRLLEDFSIRFIDFGDLFAGDDAPSFHRPHATSSQGAKRVSDVEKLVDQHITQRTDTSRSRSLLPKEQGEDLQAVSPQYALYLRQLLSDHAFVPHETFAHPAACVIAISSRSPAPIDELRSLYTESSQGAAKLPVWADGDYLRYYVLVHDEERDDISRSMVLFEHMKRNLGLHCHLLRLRSTRSAESDDDSVLLPDASWLSAASELIDIEKNDQQEDIGDKPKYIFESDATAIRTFVKELVSQSLVPTMEKNINNWNDQVASKRRGFAGRIMTLSRRWVGVSIGSSKSSSDSSKDDSGSNSYEALGHYRADSMEGTMRRLADFAFMLRDFKLAYSTYDVLRADFHDAKAWKYHAAANEMAAMSLLMMNQNPAAKVRMDQVDQLLEAAFYSYNFRCNEPHGALRSLLVGAELLALLGGDCVDAAARWGIRLLESKFVGPIGDALLRERMAAWYSAKRGVGSSSLGSRRRKAATWSILSAEAWLQKGKLVQAQHCVDDAKKIYDDLAGCNSVAMFKSANAFLEGLQNHLTVVLAGDTEEKATVDTTEVLLQEEIGRARRPSAVGYMSLSNSNLETAPLQSGSYDEESLDSRLENGDGYQIAESNGDVDHAER